MGNARGAAEKQFNRWSDHRSMTAPGERRDPIASSHKHLRIAHKPTTWNLQDGQPADRSSKCEDSEGHRQTARPGMMRAWRAMFEGMPKLIGRAAFACRQFRAVESQQADDLRALPRQADRFVVQIR